MLQVLLASIAIGGGPPPMTFAEDAAFLTKHTDAVVLTNSKGAAIVVVPQYQGRVMTSASDPAKGEGNGWINHELIASGKRVPHMNPFGGEERFWIGPEGGQFAVFFKPGDPFDLAHWQTPAIIDTDRYPVVERSAKRLVFVKDAALTNYMMTPFQFRIERVVEVLETADVEKVLGLKVPIGVTWVGYRTLNTLTNTGDKAWKSDTGLLSIWLLGMLKHSPTTTVIMPIQAGSEAERGPKVNDAYFGKVPADRLVTTETHVYFRADGKMRSKIGLSPKRAKPVAGSYDPVRGLLTIIHFSFVPEATQYVNSMWELQDNPYGGDVSNSYNDGPPAPGKKPLGPFYELESSSRAFSLKPGEKGAHVQATMHLRGSEAALAPIAKAVLGVELSEIKKVFR